jgi:hypothetical protein
MNRKRRVTKWLWCNLRRYSSISSPGYWNALSPSDKPGRLSRYSDGLRAGRPGFDSRKGREIFLFSTASKPALGATQPPIQWYPKLCGWCVKLTTHIHLVPRSIMVELYHNSPTLLQGEAALIFGKLGLKFGNQL